MRWVQGLPLLHRLMIVDHSLLFIALSQKYKAKRDFFLDCLADEFNFQIISAGEGKTWAGSNIYLASEKLNLRDGTQTIEKVPVKRRTLFSFVPPSRF